MFFQWFLHLHFYWLLLFFRNVTQNFALFFAVLQVVGRLQHFLQTPADRNASAKQLGGAVPSAEFPEQREIQRPGNVSERVCRHFQRRPSEEIARTARASHVAKTESRCTQGKCQRKLIFLYSIKKFYI